MLIPVYGLHSPSLRQFELYYTGGGERYVYPLVRSRRLPNSNGLNTLMTISDSVNGSDRDVVKTSYDQGTFFRREGSNTFLEPFPP